MNSFFSSTSFLSPHSYSIAGGRWDKKGLEFVSSASHHVVQNPSVIKSNHRRQENKTGPNKGGYKPAAARFPRRGTESLRQGTQTVQKNKMSPPVGFAAK